MRFDLLIDAASAEDSAIGSTPQRRYPALETLLARGDACPPPALPLEQALFALYGLQAEQTQANAALMLLGEGREPGDDYWLRIDPVCLQATRTQIALAPLQPQDLGREEAAALAAVLAPHLSAAGCELEVVHPQRWYARCRVPPAIATVAPSAGILSEAQLPTGPDSAAWRRLITEAQMLLHDAPVNHAREAAGKLPVNAIWPWSGGRLPALEQAPYGCVLADELVALGLARATRARAQPLPRDANAALVPGRAQATTLIVLAAAAPTPTTLAKLEDDWFAPLAQALRTGSIEQLRLMLRFTPERRLGRRLTRAHLRRWWRRARPVSAYA